MVRNWAPRRRPRFDPWVGKIPWWRAWQPTLVILPGESHGTEEPGRLQSTGMRRVGHNWAVKAAWTCPPSGTLSHPSRLAQSLGLSSLIHIVNFHWPSILHTVVYMLSYYSLHSSHSILPHPREFFIFKIIQFHSVTQSCPTLCNPMHCSTPGLPVHDQLPELTLTHALSQWCHPAISSSVVPFSSCLQSFPASGSFTMSQFFGSSGQSIGVSASASVLLMNTQDWSSGWTGWISLQSKGLSRVFSNTSVQKHQFFSAQLSLWSNSHIHTWPLEKP